MATPTTFFSPGGGTTAYLASARPSPGPPVLLLHAWWGLNQAIRELADRFASDGFTVLAPDLFDGSVLTSPEDAEAHVSSLTEADGERISTSASAALDHLLALPDARGDRAAVIGLSFGAMEATQLAGARPDIAALVCFYSGIFEAPDGVAYLGHFAEDDAFDDSAHVSELEPTLGEGSAAHLYPGTRHWFIEPDRPEFDAEATELAHARTVAFLRQHLG
jgi:carboxymethylenebutenolidase